MTIFKIFQNFHFWNYQILRFDILKFDDFFSDTSTNPVGKFSKVIKVSNNHYQSIFWILGTTQKKCIITEIIWIDRRKWRFSRFFRIFTFGIIRFCDLIFSNLTTFSPIRQLIQLGYFQKSLRCPTITTNQFFG